MTTSISDYLGIDSRLFNSTGAYNGFVDEDTRVFIDPRLLNSTDAPELKDSYARIRNHFSNIIKLLSRVQRPGDVFWRHASKMLEFNEVRGLCIGYSDGSTEGRGIGARLRNELLTTASKIIEAGNHDPAFFEIMGLFEKNIGADLICDMIANIIMPDLLDYSTRVFREVGIRNADTFIFENTPYLLPYNSHSGRPIILVPCDILSALPVAHSYADITRVVEFNHQLRSNLNLMISEVWGKNKRPPKSVYKDIVLSYPDFLADLISCYQTMPPSPYDFKTDPLGLRSWYDPAKEFVRDYPFNMALPANPTTEDAMNEVVRICYRFKELVQYNGLHTVLYRDRECTSPRPEETAQKLFYAVADGYCKGSNLDLSRETNSGRGAVDFKFSVGYGIRILVELKLSSNRRLVHGYSKQLPEYAKAEQTANAILLVIDVGGYSQKRWQDFKDKLLMDMFSDKTVPTVIIIEAKKKPSASKM